jgi:hypothetical protein
VTISQTWNGTGSTVFKALVVDATTPGTTSSSSSLLLDLQVGGTSLFRVGKNGYLGIISAPNASYLVNAGGPIGAAQYACTSSVGGFYWDAANSSGLFRDGDNAVALRNSTAAQTFNVYGTYTSITDYRRLSISVDNTTGNATITANKGSATTDLGSTVSINGVPVGLGKGNISTNVALGTGALNANTTGFQNTIIGKDALLNSSTGSYNVIIGSNASKATIGTNNYNTVIGAQAFENCTTSNYNSAFGQGAGFFITGGGNLTNSTNSVFFGALTKANGNSQTNQIVIGHEAEGLGSNTAVLGNASITTTALRGNVGIGTTAPAATLHVNGLDADQNTKRIALFQSNDLNIQNDFSVVGITSADTIVNTFQHRLLDLEFTNVAGTVTASTYVRMLTNGTERAGIGLADNEFVITGAATERLRISTAGNVGIGTTAPSSKLHVEGSIAIAAAQDLSWVGRAAIQSPGVGIFQISDTTGTDVNRLSFGHNNLNSPALKRVGTELQVVQAGTTAASNFAAGDADLTFIEDRFRRKGAGTPEGVVTAPIGAVYHNTTGGAGTSFYVKESGTGNTGWVAK